MAVKLRFLAQVFGCFCVMSCASALAASHDNKVEMADLFHDQGILFCQPGEPSSTQAVSLSIRCLQNDISSASLKYFDEADRKYHLLPMKKLAAKDKSRYELWEAKIPAGKSRKHYRFLLRDGTGFACYNAGGAQLSESEDNDFMVLPDFHTPQWLKDGIIYQIFPDRFFDGDPANNIKSAQYTFAGSPTVQKNWGDSPIPKKGENGALFFYGGDLAGVLAKLSYIRERLGANIVYLNPVFESPSNHKYDTSDYDHVAACLGTDDILVKLSSALHQPLAGKQGYLILDAVFNHTGDSHKWFGKYEFKANSSIKGAYQSPASPFYSYFSFTKWPDKYATFLDVDSLPKLNYASPALKKAIFASKESVALRYLRAPFSIDGWRLDAPQYADGNGKQGSDNFNHDLWREFRKAIKSSYPQAAILGENWQDASPWTAGGDQWDSVTNFDGFTQPVSEWVTGRNYDDKPARLSVKEFDRWLRLTRAHYPFNVQQCLSNHLGNHDISRFAERAQGDAGKVSVALIFQMTYVGVPTLYYGDEYGLRGGRDPDDRRTFDWSQDNGKNQLITLTHKLIELRNKYPALREGSFLSLDLNDQNNTYAYGRMDRQNRIAVVLNADTLAHDIRVPSYKLEIPDAAYMTDELSGVRYQAKDGELFLRLEPSSGAVLVY